MKLPNAAQAQVPEKKAVRYLLNPTHPTGGSKARFFLSFGFHSSAWKTLAEALLRLARVNDVVETAQTAFGTRYVIDGAVVAPSGAILNVRTAWFIDHGGNQPRFVTAHPLPRL